MECRKDEWESAGPFYRNFELGLLNVMARSEILPHTLSPTDLVHSKFQTSQCTKFECFKIINNSNWKELPLNSTYRRLNIYCISDSLLSLQNFRLQQINFNCWSGNMRHFSYLTLQSIGPNEKNLLDSIYSRLAKWKFARIHWW